MNTITDLKILLDAFNNRFIQADESVNYNTSHLKLLSEKKKKRVRKVRIL